MELTAEQRGAVGKLAPLALSAQLMGGTQIRAGPNVDEMPTTKRAIGGPVGLTC